MLSDLFFIINFSFVILISTVSLAISLITILIIIKDQQLRTFDNILICNTSVAIIFHSIVIIINSTYGFREDWTLNAPLCSFRAYCRCVTITATCYSVSIRVLSHLFFSVLHKYRHLLTWHAHRILIILNWIIAIIVCIPPFFIEGGYALEKESRSCTITTKMYLLALYYANVSCIIPLNIVVIVYVLILISVRRSTRRIQAFSQNIINVRNTVWKTKRELKLMQQLANETSLLILGGSIYIVLIVWHATQKQPPPEPLHLISLNLMPMFMLRGRIVQFIINEQLKRGAIQFLCRRQPIIVIKTRIHRQQQPWHIT